MERKIGEIFEYNGEWYQCVVAIQGCRECSFRTQDYCTRHSECMSTERSDKTSVIFKKLEKVGEPYRFGKLLMQQYRIFTEAYIPKGFDLVCVLCRHGKVISIEIEQNKENMKKERRAFKAKEKEEQHSTENCPVQAEEIADRIVGNAFKNVETQLEKNVRKLKARDFNLEEAKAGKPVCTRDGRKARIICFDRDWDMHIVALVADPTGESVHYYLSNGKVDFDRQLDDDLMMSPEKKEGWVNVYKGGLLDTKFYNTKKEAFDKASPEDYVDTVKINWSE